MVDYGGCDEVHPLHVADFRICQGVVEEHLFEGVEKLLVFEGWVVGLRAGQILLHLSDRLVPLLAAPLLGVLQFLTWQRFYSGQPFLGPLAAGLAVAPLAVRFIRPTKYLEVSEYALFLVFGA